MSELDGPKRSKSSIDQFESWLKERLRNGPVKIKTLEREYQYLTGHEPRKIRQYLYAIESGGKIQLRFTEGAECCELCSSVTKENTKRPHKPAQPAELDETSETPFTDYVKRKIRKEVQQKLREKLTDQLEE